MPKTASAVIDAGAEGGEAPPRDPEKAGDALASIQFDSEAPNAAERPARPGAPAPEPDAEPPKKVRRTKAELEAEVSRLAAEVEAQQQRAAASAPDVIESMKVPLAMTFSAAFEAAAAFRGEHWKLREEQATALGAVWAPVVGPLVQSHPEYVVWAGAIAVSYGIVVPRVKMDRELAEAKEREKKSSTVEVIP